MLVERSEHQNDQIWVVNEDGSNKVNISNNNDGTFPDWR